MALSLDRTVYETIKIGKDIVLTVTKIDGANQSVRIKIDCPRDMLILRGELEDRNDEDDDNRGNR